MSEKMGFETLRAKYKDVLSKAFSTNNIDLLDSFSKNINESDRKAAMDQAFRDKLLELLTEDAETLENYVNFCIESCRRQMVTPTMPVVLLGDIFDALTLNKCEKMFTYIENGVNIWKEELFFVACKNNLLRMCNDLLRRLSRSQNTVFCGRILLFLAKFFPFSERSGLNIVSEFNLENITEFGGDNTSTLKDSLDEEMMVEEKTKLNIDYNLYCRFWSLQDFFRNPNTCYNKIQWKTFVAHSGSVLSAFSSYKLEAVELQKSKMNRLKPVHTDNDMQGAKEQHYFAKFLTNQKLLELQLSDSNFRRCVLIQFLILFQYLSSTVKFKMETQELKKDQTDWVKETTSLIYRLLGETPPDGQRFAECVQHILKREEHWNAWKNDGCPEFQKPKPPASGEDEVRKSKVRRRPVGDIIKEYESQQKCYMGNNDLTKLWNLCPDNLSACRTKERDFMPSLQSRFLPLFEVKRFDRPIGPGGLPPLTTVPIAGERCSQRLESALDQMKRRKRNQPKTLDTPASQSIDLNGYSLYQQMRSAPVDMYVTRMRVRLPQNANWVRVEKCYFDPRNVSLDTMLLFHDITISGSVDLFDSNELDRNIPPSRRLRRHYADNRRYDAPYPDEYRYRQGNGCNMILRLRKAGIGFHTRPLNHQPGKFNVKTDSEFVEPGFISVYAYGCEKYINRNSVRNKDNLPLRRRKRSDEFTFDPHLNKPDDYDSRTADDTWNTVYEPRSRVNYERSKLFRPDDDLDEIEDISREMEDIFTKGIRTLLTTYMKKELQPAIKDTLMRNMGYVISYG